MSRRWAIRHGYWQARPAKSCHSFKGARQRDFLANNMEYQSTSANFFDIVFVGGGVSTIYTLLNLLHCPASPGARKSNPGRRIAVVEQTADGLGGLPYSVRSGYTSLLITSLRHFLPDAERALFVEWLNENKNWMFDLYQRHGGEISAQWRENHPGAIPEGRLGELFFPPDTLW